MEVSVVTGASSGIGRALCLALAHGERAGSRLVLAVARREEELHLLAKEAAEAGGGLVVPVPADITTDAGCAAVCDAVAAALQKNTPKHASHVVHCAGMLENVGQSCFEITPLDLRRALALNVEAPVNLTVALRSRGLIEPGVAEGRVPTRVLFVGSGAAHKAIKGWPTYTISKAALWAAVRQLHSEGNMVASARPGIVDTPMLRRARAATADQGVVITADPSMLPQPPSKPAGFLCSLLLDTTQDTFLNGGAEWDYKTDQSKLVWHEFNH